MNTHTVASPAARRPADVSLRVAHRRRCGLVLPPTLDARTIVRIPRRLFDDAVQTAWVAYLAGRNPNTAAAGYVNRVRRRERRMRCFSDLDAAEMRAVRNLAAP